MAVEVLALGNMNKRIPFRPPTRMPCQGSTLLNPELLQFLNANAWRLAAFNVICDIPRGSLASYGYIAGAIRETGFSVSPRTIGWLRRRIYGFLGHESEVPLHRVARAGDVHSRADSERTRARNDMLRQAEGSIERPNWLR
jgi:alkylated DNA nucleotide flippase Atl1